MTDISSVSATHQISLHYRND